MQVWRTTAGLALALLVAAGMTLEAQKVVKTTPGKAGSPHETVEWSIGGAKIQIIYGRPFLKGRKFNSPDFVPYGQVYRLGADEATTLITDKPLMFGTLMVPAGTYTLYSLPSAEGWKLIVNKQTGQWGTEYHEDQDLGRTDLKTEKLTKPVEQLTLSLDASTFKIQWGDSQFSAPFMVH